MQKGGFGDAGAPPTLIQNFLKILLLQQHQQPAFRPAFFNIIINTTN